MEDRRIAGLAVLGDSLGTRIEDSQSAGLETRRAPCSELGDSQGTGFPHTLEASRVPYPPRPRGQRPRT